MSHVQQIALNGLKDWVNKETAQIVEPLKNRGQSLLKETQGRLDDVLESSLKILESSQKEMEKTNPKTYRFSRNAYKFAENLSKTIEAFKIPEQVSYDNFQTFYNNLNSLIGTIDQLRREAYPYISPYFIFDRRRLDATIKRLQDINGELGTFLTTRYVKAKTAEDVPVNIDKLTETIKEARENKGERLNVQQLEESLKTKLQEVKQKGADIQNKAELIELLAVEEKIEELRENVKHDLRYLQKPFVKLQSRAKDGSVALPVSEAEKLRNYLSDPFEALANEESGYPALKAILRILNEAINQNKLKLKSTRLRKAQEQIDGVLNRESLTALQSNCVAACSQKTRLLSSNTVTMLQQELTQLRNEFGALRKENEFTTSRAEALENEYKRLQEKIASQTKELEKTTFQLTNKSIQIILPEI